VPYAVIIINNTLCCRFSVVIEVVLQCSCAQLRRETDRSPIALMKSVKNDVEIAGMRNAHVSDSRSLSVSLSPVTVIGHRSVVSSVAGQRSLVMVSGL